MCVCVCVGGGGGGGLCRTKCHCGEEELSTNF
jgi:hypothetical protein